MIPEDYNFIMATWLRGIFYGESIFSLMKKDTFMNKYHKILTYLLTQPGLSIRVACLKDDPSVILGYSVMDKDEKVLHWVFTKKSWRNIGIARSLVPTTVQKITHLTKLGLAIVSKHSTLEFDPFLVT